MALRRADLYPSEVLQPDTAMQVPVIAHHHQTKRRRISLACTHCRRRKSKVSLGGSFATNPSCA